jgi:hypothetical protein
MSLSPFNRPILALAMALGFIFDQSSVNGAERRNGSDKKSVKELTGDRDRMIRVTIKPVQAETIVSMLCRPADGSFVDPHEEHWIHVFVGRDGASAMKTQKGKYPVGTVFLKQKFSDSEGKHSRLYTGMRKREGGYNPNCGDWEFFTLNAAASKVTSRGKLESCMSCHEKYRASDCISRSYMAGKEMTVK